MGYAYLCGSYATIFMVPSHPVSVFSLPVAFYGYRLHAPTILDLCIQLPFQRLEKLGHRAGVIIQVGHDCLLEAGIV